MLNHNVIENMQTFDELKRAINAHKSKEFNHAKKLYEIVLKKNPHNADALHFMGILTHQTGTPEEALSFIIKAIGIDNSNPVYFNSLGCVYRSLGMHVKSIGCFNKAIRITPHYAEAHYNLGVACQTDNNLTDAICHYRNAIHFNPQLAEAYNNLGAALNKKGNPSEALKYCSEAIQLKPDYSEAFNNLGNAQKELGQLKQAILSYQRAIKLSGGCSEILGNLGNAFCNAGKYDEALDSYNQAIVMDPSNGKAYNNMGTLLRYQRRLDDAIACFEKSIRLMPQDVEAYHNLGNVHYDRSNYKLAIACYQKALTIDPHSLKTLINLGICFQEKGDSDIAVDLFGQVLASDPENYKACCHLAHEMYQRCQWDLLDSLNRKIDRFTDEKLESGQRPEEMPFLNLIRRSDPSINFKVAQKWSDLFMPAHLDTRDNLRSVKVETKGKKLTIGYLSNNFRNHPTAQLTWKIFALHDRQQFNVNVYSYGEDDSSEHRKRIEKDCDKFTDLRMLDHRDASNCICHDQVDILVDLVGYMRNHRLEIASMRPAPIQVRWLGLAGTTGADFFDYLITDPIVTPIAESSWYTENFVYMPNSYQVNSRPLKEAEKTFSRNELGLPEKGFVFCCFCSSYKIDPVMFSSWIQILKGVADSVLWLLKGNPIVERNLKREARRSGVDPDRLIFADKISKEDHLRRIVIADLALDTGTISGAATTSDALYAGVPVLSLKGTHFASRMSASILNAIGLDELACRAIKDYEEKAVKMGNNPLIVKELKKRLIKNRKEKPLFDTQRFVKDLEAAYSKMWDRYQEGKPPGIIHVDGTP